VEEDGARTSWTYDAAGRLVRVEYPADKIRAIREAQDVTIEPLRPAPDEGAGGQGRTHGQGDADRPGSGQGKAKGRDKGRGDGEAKGNGRRNDSPDPGAGPETFVAETLTPAYTLPVREWVQYEYDAAGNRVRETSDLGTVLYTYDEAGRLLSAGDVTYEYDPAGRLIRRSAPDEDVAYSYDAAGRLREVSFSDGTGVLYGYDALGRKVSREATFWTLPDPERRGPSEKGLEHGRGHRQGEHKGLVKGKGQQTTPPGLARPRLETETTTYLWDGLRVLAEYTGEGAPLAEYYVAGDRILARKMFGYHGRKGPGAPDLQTRGGLLHYTYDGIGNVCLLTDRLGEVVCRYRYDAFGGLLTSATAPYNLYGPFGKEFDPVSGLVYFGARWYDASVGRFTTPDPFPGTVTDPLTRNPYLFVLANPVNFVDRWGLHPEEHRYVVEETEDYIEV
jgi:RHS repeat-associated protein